VPFLATVAALALAGAVLLPRFFSFVEDPRTSLLLGLKRLEKDGLTLPIDGASEPLRSERIRVDRVTVQLAPDGRRGRVVYSLDFDGRVGPTRVSALGREAVSVAYSQEGWRPEGGAWTPLLARALARLEERARALQAGDREALSRLLAAGSEGALDDPRLAQVMRMSERLYQAKSWSLRLEADAIMVTEDYRLSGVLPDRPVEEVGHRRLTLLVGEKELRFGSSLM
jgi:hypothetical protein